MSYSNPSIQSGLKQKLPESDDWTKTTTTQDETFIVEVLPEPSRHEDAEADVTGLGGEILQNSGPLQQGDRTLLIVEVEAGSIKDLASRDSVRLVGEWSAPTTHEVKPPAGYDGDLGTVTQSNHVPSTEGIEITGADALHNLGVTGEGTTIAVLDNAFDTNNEQYADQVVGTLGSSADFAGGDESTYYEAPGAHGDACADIVAAMAPDADIVVGTIFDPSFGIFDALDELEAEFPEVDVCTMSVGYLPDFPINGTDPYSARIDQFTDENRIFTNSAGNSAAVEQAYQWDSTNSQPVSIPLGTGDAWDGEFVDNSGNDLLEFDANFSDSLTNSERLPVTTPVTLADQADDSSVGWVITHWDADPIVDDQRYTARLYPSPNASNPLEYPSSGDPVESQTNDPWETIDAFADWFKVDVTINNNGTDGWQVTSVDGADDLASLNVDNPDLTLGTNERYRFQNNGWDTHPFELRNSNGDPLLSQDPNTEGSFESDSDVAWEDNGDSFAFTMTVPLAQAVATYVSTSNPNTMQGSVTPKSSQPRIYAEVERTNATGDHHFDVWGQFGDVNIPTPWATDERTIGIPAVSRDPDLLAIAAAQAVDLGDGQGETEVAYEINKGDLKGYSSQGPTQDGRQGIDLTGPAHVSTNARGPVEDVFGFNGTSAAAPHVGAGVGLLSATDLDATTADIREALSAASGGIPDSDVGSPPNQKIGEGYMDVFGAYNQLVADGDVNIQIQGSTPVPNRTLVTDQSEDQRFGSDQYELTAIKAATPGDSLEVNVAAPTDLEYNIEIFDNNLDRLGFRAGTGNTTVTFDTANIGVDDIELDPGMYVVAAVKDGDALAAFPVIIEAYNADIVGVSPADPKTGDTLEVTADITEAIASPPAIEDVMLAGFTESDDSGLAVTMEENTSTGRWEVAVSDPPAEDYQLHVAPRGGDNVNFEIQELTIEEETATGDLSTDSPQTETLISVGGSEPIGLSPAENVTVELADADALEQVWSQDSGALSTTVAGQLQFSRPALDNENVYVGGLDEYVTGHARNSGELRWNVERNGALSDSSPVYYDGTVYVGDGGGLLHAIDASDGTVNWSYDTANDPNNPPSAITSTPAVFDDGTDVWVFFGANNGTIHAVKDNGSSFTNEWAQNFDNGAVYSDLEAAVVLDLPWVFVTTNDGRVLVLDVLGQITDQPGQLLIDADAPTSSFGSSSPVVDDDGNLYVAGDTVAAIDVPATVDQGDLSSLPLTEGVTNWVQSDYGGNAGSNPMLTSTGIYVGSEDGDLYAMRRSDGNILWQGKTEAAITSTPAVTNGRVVVGSLDERLYVFDQATGERVGVRAFGTPIRSDPIALNDNVYIGLEDGTVRNLQNIP